MIIESALLSEDIKQLKGEQHASFLELDQDLFFKTVEPARYELYAQKVSSELVVRGSVTVRLSCRCARCDEWFLRNMCFDRFTRSYKLTTENESIDLTSDIREDILLVLPTYFVCSPECCGLCQRCGINLNKQSCACGEQEKISVWNKLNRLNIG